MSLFKKWFGKKEDRTKETTSAESPESPETGAAPQAEEAAGTSQGEAEEEAPPRSRWSFVKSGFAKTRAGLRSLFRLRGKLDDATIDSIEGELYAADFGPEMVDELIDGPQGLRAAWKAGKIENQEEVLDFFKSHLKQLLNRRDIDLASNDSGPTVLLIAGVNGSGKTTSIAKIAHRLKSEGRRVLLAAADTFRAAAVEQLTIWSERLEIEIVTGKPKSDPASVAYTAAQRALDEGYDCLIVDTAGRLHTDKNLMRELHKIRNVVARKVEGAPHESLLVLDGTNGQNAIQQAIAFKREIDVTGIVLTKLDGTAKGGAVFAIHQRLDIPVKLVGLGEKLENLATFDPDDFVDALFEGNE